MKQRRSLQGPRGRSTVNGVNTELIPFLEEHNDRGIPGALVRAGDCTGPTRLTARVYFGSRSIAHASFSLRVRGCVPTVLIIQAVLTTSNSKENETPRLQG